MTLDPIAAPITGTQTDRDHIRLTTQPLENPAERKQLHNLLETIDGQHTLLFATDYAHRDFDDPTATPLPKAWQEDIFRNNALKTYRRLGKQAG